MTMGRPKTINKPQITSLVLGDEHRAAIKVHIGDETISEYIRECIMLRTSIGEGAEQEEEIRLLKEKSLKQEKQLKQYEQAEKKTTERHQAELEQMKDHFIMYTTDQKNPSSINRWLHMRVKNIDATVDEAHSYLEAEGLLEGHS